MLDLLLKEVDCKIITDSQHYLAKIRIRCRESGQERKISGQLPKQLALQYEIFVYICVRYTYVLFSRILNSRLFGLIVSTLFQSLKMLSVMSAIRLDDETDNIENTLSLALVDSNSGSASNKAASSLDALASSTWEKVVYNMQKSCVKLKNGAGS